MSKKRATRAKKVSSQKRSARVKAKNAPRSQDLSAVSSKLDRILATQRQILAHETAIEREELEIETGEKSHLEKLHEIETFARTMKEELGVHPLLKITHRDVAKGSIGAFFGVAAHYTFVYGVKVAHQIGMVRATITFVLAYLVGAVFLYLTGFRTVKVERVALFLPFRLTVLYVTAIVTAFGVLWLFQPDFLHSFEGAFKALATVTLSATIGACTADLIGRE